MKDNRVQMVLLVLISLVLLALVVQQPPVYEGGPGEEYLDGVLAYSYMTRIAVVVIGAILTIMWFYSHNYSSKS